MVNDKVIKVNNNFYYLNNNFWIKVVSPLIWVSLRGEVIQQEPFKCTNFLPVLGKETLERFKMKHITHLNSPGILHIISYINFRWFIQQQFWTKLQPIVRWCSGISLRIQNCFPNDLILDHSNPTKNHTASREWWRYRKYRQVSYKNILLGKQFYILKLLPHYLTWSMINLVKSSR